MAVEYKTTMTKSELLELAIVNGIDVDDGMTKAAIIAAIDAHNAQEAAEDGGGDNDTAPDENAAQDGAESATGDNESDVSPESPEEGAQDGTEDGGGTGEDNDTTQPENSAESATEGAEDAPGGYDLFVYAGPTLPRGRLKENAVFRGTFEDVKAYLADVLEEYPQVENLIVPVNRLAAFSVKVKNPGNLAHKYYSDIVSAMRGKEV